MADETIDNGPDVIVLKFADSAVPCFKESRDKEYIKYGDDNNYPAYLTFLFDKSANHNAIVTGKSNYIFGEGYANGDFILNQLGESLNDITAKSILDVVMYGGFRWEIIWGMGGKITEIYHVDYSTIRKGKEGGYYYKETWANKYDREDPEFIAAFDPKIPAGTQIYSYDEYRPGVRYYPLPDYLGCNNYIETDIEISKFYLSSIRNGMLPSKMIQFFQGELNEEKKRSIEKRFRDKFAGSENAGKFVLVFNTGDPAKAVQINDLSANDLDKMFIELNKTVQQQIFSGHKVTSPMLFGIKTEGQLGGTTELKISYEIFQNTYAGLKAKAIDKEVNYVLAFSRFTGAYTLQNADPVGLQFDVKDYATNIAPEFILEKLGVPKDQWRISPTAATDIPAPGTPGAEKMANDNIKNLSAKQHQQLVRIIRQYSKGQLTESAAKTLLRVGLNLNDEDINQVLGIQTAFTSDLDEDGIIEVFDSFGDSKNDYEILKTKKVGFELEEIEEDEAVYIQEAFLTTYDVTLTEDKILELIKKDPKITSEVIASTIRETKGYVDARITSLAKRGYLESTVEKIGADEIISRFIPKAADIKAPPPPEKNNLAKVSIKYSYEPKPGLDPIIPTTRAFCKKMIQLNRLYSRADIEKISSRLGYSVWDRKGGWWGHKEECRHRWVSHIVVRKDKEGAS